MTQVRRGAHESERDHRQGPYASLEADRSQRRLVGYVPGPAPMTNRSQPPGRLSAQRQVYAEARARGLTMTEAAAEAGSKRPSEAGSRWDKDPFVLAAVADIKDRALAVRQVADAIAIQAGYGPATGRAQVPAQAAAEFTQAVTQVAQAAVARRIASRDDALGILTCVMEGRLGAYLREDGSADVGMLRDAPPGVVKALRWKDGEIVGLTLESSVTAAKAIIEHYAGKGPVGGSTTVNLGVIVGKLPEDVQRQLARAMLAADSPGEWTEGGSR